MSRIRFGVSPWTLASAATSRRFPTTPDVDEADIVVVGAGLTGLLTARALKAAGRGVVLLDAGRVGTGQSLSASGLTGLLGAVEFRAFEASHGRRVARTLFSGVRHGGTVLARGLKQAKVAARVDARDLLSFTETHIRGWERDAAARKAAGLDATPLSGAALARVTTAEVSAALRIPGGGLVEPGRVLTGAVTRLGAARVKVFERSRVTKITFTRTDATVHVGPRSIRASRVVVCTDAPGALAPTLDRHVRAVERFHVLTAPMPAAMRKAVALTSVVACDTAVHLAVTATADGRLLLSGGDAPPVSDRARAEALVQRTGQLMYECLRRYPVIAGIAPAFGWSSPIVAAPDRFPLVGPHRQYPHQLFSFGTDNDPALAWLASDILVRAALGRPTATDVMFGFGRVQEERD